MMSNDLLMDFCKNRNLKLTTVKTYSAAIRKYESFHNNSIKFLINEAISDENTYIPLKNRRIKKRLLNFRNYLIANYSINTVRTYFSRIMAFYKHFEIELPYLNDIKFDNAYLSSYLDLPTKKDIMEVCSISRLSFKAVVLFISSSGCAKAETLSLAVGDFVRATNDYHSGGSIEDILDELAVRKDVVAGFYLKRIKTGKFYYTFCSPEASFYIVMYNFKKVNDRLGMGFVGNYRFFRSHSLRKFHASNIGLSADYVDELQGRAKTKVHEAYIKTNPKRLKEIYMGAMHNVMIFDDWIEEYEKKTVKSNGEGACVIEKQEINIVINFTLDGKDFRI